MWGVGVGVGVAVGIGVGVAVGGRRGVGAAVIVKFVSEISKKILPTASTFIRAVDVGVLGIKTDSEPSLAVLAARTVGNVLPPSVEREILTFAALTGAAVVLATFQVTVRISVRRDTDGGIGCGDREGSGGAGNGHG